MKYYYCFSSNSNLFRGEIDYARSLGNIIFYDYNRDIFLDNDNNQIDISDMVIFPRSSIKESIRLLGAIKRHNGKSIISVEDYYKTLNWPYYIKTKRNCIILSGSEIINNPKLLIDMFGYDKVFFKTKDKNFSGIIDISNLLDLNSPFYLALKDHLDEDFIISQVVSIDSDKYGLLEYRAFVIQGEVFNVSRIGNDLPNDIPNDVISKLKEIVNYLKENSFSNSYVIDLFIYIDKKGNRIVDVLECNPIIASGTYLYNSIFNKNFSLDNACFNKRNFNGSNMTRFSSAFYNMSSGFSADLTSYTLFGYKSNGDTGVFMEEDVKKLSRR